MVEYDFESARAGTRELLSGSERPTAIFAHDDLLAAGALRAAHDLGLRVPQEVEVVGFDDSELAQPLGLTTVRQPLEESGAVALELLLAHINDPARTPQHTTLGLKLVERDTTHSE